MRVSNLTTQSRITRDLNRARSDFADKQLQISSGRRFTRRSEQPADASEVARLEQHQNDNAQWLRNTDQALNVVRITGARIDSIVDRLHRANEMVIRANDGSLSENDRNNMAVEVDVLLHELAATANSKVDGSYLFSGTRTDTPPFQFTYTDGKITTAEYVGNEEKKSIPIGEQMNSNAGIPGGGAGGLFSNTSGQADVFQHLIQLRDQLSAGESPTDGIAEGLTQDLDHAISHLVANGVEQSRLTTISDQYGDSEHATETRIGNLQNLDVAKAITELSQMEASFQASLQMATRINQLSLINFI